MPGSICQLSYILIDYGEVSGKNYYFKVGYIEPGAQRVHGLSVDDLEKLSGGKKFYNRVDEIYIDFSTADLLVAHNFSFDKKFMEAEFNRCGKSFTYKRYFDTMINFAPVCKIQRYGNGYKYPNLREMTEYFEVINEDIETKVKELFGGNMGRFHDARYDVAATYLCYIKGV